MLFIKVFYIIIQMNIKIIYIYLFIVLINNIKYSINNFILKYLVIIFKILMYYLIILKEIIIKKKKNI